MNIVSSHHKNTKGVADFEDNIEGFHVKRGKVVISPPPLLVLLETDVLFFGDKKMTCMHPGNEAFAKTIKLCTTKCRKVKDKPIVSRGIVEGLANRLPPVRFLFCNKESGDWSTLSNSDAVLITAHALQAAERQQYHQEYAEIASKYGETSWQCDFYKIFHCDPLMESVVPPTSETIAKVVDGIFDPNVPFLESVTLDNFCESSIIGDMNDSDEFE